jgi:hypothetical protein
VLRRVADQPRNPGNGLLRIPGAARSSRAMTTRATTVSGCSHDRCAASRG